MRIQRNPDGERHFGWGAFLACLIYYGAYPSIGTSWAFGLAVVSVGVIGWLVEVSQKKWGWGTYDISDISATFQGGVVGTLAMGVIGWATG